MSLYERLKKRLREFVWEEPVKKRLKINHTPRPEEDPNATEVFTNTNLFENIIEHTKEPKRGDPSPDFWSEDCVTAYTLDMLKKTCRYMHLSCNNYVSRHPIKITDPRVTHQYMAVYMGSVSCLDEARRRFPFVHQTWMTTLAISMDNFRMLRYLKSISYGWDDNACILAARNGNVEILRYAVVNGAPFHPESVSIEAAERGHLGILKCVFDFMKMAKLKIRVKEQPEMDRKTSAHNSVTLECHPFVYCFTDATLEAAALNGHLECLRYLVLQKTEISRRAAGLAASRGHYDCLVFLDSKGADIHMDALYQACGSESLECVTYLVNRGCLVEAKLLTRAISCRREAVAVYLLKAGCPMNEDIVECAIVHGMGMIVKKLLKRGARRSETNVNLAISHRSVDALKHLHKSGMELRSKFTKKAIKYSSFDCLKYLVENQCPWHHSFCEKAVKYDAIKYLEYAVTNGAHWGIHTLEIAAKYGNRTCFEYLLSVKRIISHEEEMRMYTMIREVESMGYIDNDSEYEDE